MWTESYIPALMDIRSLSPPKAGLAENTVSTTKPEMIRVMIERLVDADHRIDWITGNEVYGCKPKLQTVPSRDSLLGLMATQAGKVQ